MAKVLGLYAGTSSSLTYSDLLPSPDTVTPTIEQIWDENTGRAQSGSNRAMMIGDSIAEKNTYNIKWGILNATQFSTVKTKLSTGFFYFGLGTQDTVTLANSSPPSTPSKYYRSEISYEIIQVPNASKTEKVETFYKGVQVSVIEQ